MGGAGVRGTRAEELQVEDKERNRGVVGSRGERVIKSQT